MIRKIAAIKILDQFCFVALAATLLMGLTFWPSDSQADLGDTLISAKANVNVYKRKFGAIEPLFSTNASGRVIWECWAAPAKQWSKAQTLALVNNLISVKTASKSPKFKGLDGTFERYVYGDGTVAILQVFQGRYTGVEVHTSVYSGAHC